MSLGGLSGQAEGLGRLNRKKGRCLWGWGLP